MSNVMGCNGDKTRQQKYENLPQKLKKKKNPPTLSAAYRYSLFWEREELS